MVAHLRRPKRSILGPFLFPGIVLGLAFLAWLAIYAYDKGFTQRWRKFVKQEFSERGIELDFDKLTLDPLQGLVAHDIRIYESPARAQQLVQISDIKLDVNVIRAIAGDRDFIKSIDLKDSALSLPIDPENPMGDKLTIENLNARVYLSREKIEVRRITADLAGIDISISGSLFIEDESKKDEPTIGLDKKTVDRWRSQLAAAFTWLENIRFEENAAPALVLQVEGDTSAEDGVLGSMRFTSGPFSIGETALDSASALVTMKGEDFTLKELHLTADDDVLHGHGSYSSKSKIIEFRVDSEINLPGILRSIHQDVPPILSEVVFYSHPEIHADGTWNLAVDNGLELVGRVSCDRVSARGVHFGIRGDFSASPTKLFIRNVELEHQSGSANLQLLKDGNTTRYDATVRLDPAIIAPFVRRPATAEFLRSFEIHNDSTVRINLEGGGEGNSMATWTSRGSVDLHEVKFRGVDITSFEADLRLLGPDQNYENIELIRPEGRLTADRIAYQAITRDLKIENVVSNLDVPEVLRCFNKKLAERLRVYKFEQHPNVRVSGTVGGPTRTKQTLLDIAFSSPTSAHTNFAGKNWKFDNVKGSVRIVETRSNVSVGGTMFDGQTDVQFRQHEDDIQGTLICSEVDFQKVATFMNSEQSTTGKLDLKTGFRSDGTGLSGIDAQGTATLSEGNVFAIPLFGPLSPIIENVMPKAKAGYSVARTASMDFKLNKGKLSTDSLEALTPAFRLNVVGEVDLKEGVIAADATMNLRGAPGFILSPVSKLLEYRATGDISAPRWLPRRLVSPLGGRAEVDERNSE